MWANIGKGRVFIYWVLSRRYSHLQQEMAKLKQNFDRNWNIQERI